MKHFTTSVYILHDEKVLLLDHAKLGVWLPPGGHIEANETPVEAAHREVLEETGCHIELLSDEHLDIDYWNAKSFPRPFLCLLENIPAYKNHIAHKHIDLLYLARLLSAPPALPAECRWFSLAEIELLVDDKEIFAETKRVLQYAFTRPLHSLDRAARR